MPKDKRYGVNGRSRGLIPIPPGNVPSETRCVAIQIPDSQDGLLQLFGVLYELTHWQNFERESQHKGTLWAQAWKRAITASMPVGVCGEDMPQTLIEYNSPCGLRYSYDNGDTWTDIDLSTCADFEIAAQIFFRVVDNNLEVSLDGGETYTSIYDAETIATTVADTEIAAQILFRVVDNNLEVSLDGGETYTSIYDAETIATTVADQEIAAQILFRVVDNNLEVSLDGGETYTSIYDAETIAESIEHIQDVGQDVDNPNILRKKVDGEWLQFADLSLASGIIQPAPGGTIAAGTCKYLNMSLVANQKVLIPVAVYGGYQITVVGDYGGATDGLINWYCIDGRDYLLGQCQGSPESAFSSDPMPDKYHMELIMMLPDSTYTTMRRDEPYVVPSSMTEGYYQLLLNDGNLSDNSGSFQLTVEVCAPISSNFITLTYGNGSGPTEVYEGQEFTVTPTFHSEYGGYGQFGFTTDQCAMIQWVSGNVNGRSGGGVDMNWADGCSDPAYYVEYGGGATTVNAHQGEQHTVNSMSSTHGLESGPFVFRVVSI